MRNAILWVWAAALTAMAIACGDSGSGDAGKDGRVLSDGSLELPPPEDGVQLDYEFTVPPGGEIEVCKYMKLDRDIDVGRFFARMREGSHHFILFYSDDADLPDGSLPCNAGVPRGQGGGFIDIMLGMQTVFTSQTKSAELDFPADVALKMKAGGQLILNSHYINYGTEPITGEILINLEPFGSETGAVHYAQPMFFLNPAIDLAPGEVDMTEMSCGMPDGAQVVTLSSHTHELGTSFDIYLHDKAARRDLDLVYTNDNWEEPEFVVFDPPMSLAPDEGFRFECHYENTRDYRVGFGNESVDEMCILLGYYYVDGAEDYGQQLCVDGLLEIAPQFLKTGGK